MNLPAVALDDLLADGEADASSRVLSAGVQPLEQSKNPLLVLRLDADPIVSHAKCRGAMVPRGGDLHERRFTRAVELDAVGDQVLKQLAELSRIAAHHRQIGTRDAGT